VVSAGISHQVEGDKMMSKSYSWIDGIPSTFSCLLFIAQIIVGIYLLSEVSQIAIVAYVGVGIYVFSGIVFGMFPIIEFHKKGCVKKGKSYIHTTTLVDTGIYSIVRHPQFTTWILWAIAGMLLFQHWIVILLGISIIPLTYVDVVQADKRLVTKFGKDYRQYMHKVPRANFLVGLFRLLRDRT
jgi:protein-S-isoprenylcysteine O-methyltransferase Ste14